MEEIFILEVWLCSLLKKAINFEFLVPTIFWGELGRSRKAPQPLLFRVSRIIRVVHIFLIIKVNIFLVLKFTERKCIEVMLNVADVADVNFQK